MTEKQNKIITTVFFIFFFGIFFLPIFISCANSCTINDYARITEVDYQAVVMDDYGTGGKVLITERLTFDIHAASEDNLFWELWRDLPEDYVDGLKVDYKVNYVKQINDDGTKTTYSESPKLYWYDSDYTSSVYGPGKWYHSKGPYNEETADYECLMIYVDGLYRGKYTFEIQYVMNNASLRYSDVSELYLSMYSGDSITYLEHFKGQILVPNKDMPAEGNYQANTFGTNSNVFDFQESDTLNPGYRTFSFELDEDDLEFQHFNQFIEFSLLSFNEDVHIFTDYAPYNYYSDDVYLEEALQAIKEYEELPEKDKTNKTIFLSISLIASFVVVIFVISRDAKIKKRYQLDNEVQEIEYFRDIPSDLDPHFAATLVFCKDKKKVDMGDSYAAMLLNLIRAGYIETQKIDHNKDWDQKNILLKILYTPTTIATAGETTEKVNINGKKLEKLSANEEAYFNLIVKHASRNSNNSAEISMDDFQKRVYRDYNGTEKFVTSVEDSVTKIGVSEKYFRKSNFDFVKHHTKSLANAYLILSIIIIVLGNIIICSATRLGFGYGGLLILGLAFLFGYFRLKKCSYKYVLLTQFGDEEYMKWRALYNFMNDGTLLNEKTVIEWPLWEKYLVYATAFGISDKVIKALEINCPDMTQSPILSTGLYCSHGFRTSTRAFSTASSRATSMSRSMSGGGYGGGGRGGGGGGGGH